jgi:large subunit ribosomal protein L7/L12
MKRTANEIAKDISKLNQLEINELCETLLHEHDISATMYRLSPPSLNEDRFDVVLHDAGKRKLLVVKTLKDLLGLGLREAKDYADSTPVVITSSASEKQAELFVQELGNSGATVILNRL